MAFMSQQLLCWSYLSLQSGVYLALACEINFVRILGGCRRVHEDTGGGGGGGEGCRRVSLLLSLMCSLCFLGLSAIIRCIGLDWSITVGVVCVMQS